MWEVEKRKGRVYQTQGAAFQRHEEAASSYSAVVIVGFEGQGLPL